MGYCVHNPNLIQLNLTVLVINAMFLDFKSKLKLNQTQSQQLARHAYNWVNGLCLAILDHNKTCSASEKNYISHSH